MDLGRAAGFIEERGSPFDKARLYYLTKGAIPDAAILRPLVDTQSKDGGFPSRPRPGNASSVDSTLTALWKLDESGLFPSSIADRALDFLASMQHADGSWDENPSLPAFDLAPWVIPGNLATRLYLSAYSAYWFGLTERKSESLFEKAVQFLAQQQEDSGKIPGYQHNTWIGAGVFLLAGESYRSQADAAVQFLADQPFEAWEDSQVAWALDILSRAGLPADHEWAAAGLEHLRRKQAENGSWASEDGPSFVITATLQVLKVFNRYELKE
jgi:hypothetical protein